MSDINDLKKELEELESKVEHTRNIVDKSKYVDRINSIKKQLSETNVEKKAIFQNDVPVVADHVDSKISRGDITNTGNTFIATI